MKKKIYYVMDTKEFENRMVDYKKSLIKGFLAPEHEVRLLTEGSFFETNFAIPKNLLFKHIKIYIEIVENK